MKWEQIRDVFNKNVMKVKESCNILQSLTRAWVLLVVDAELIFSAFGLPGRRSETQQPQLFDSKDS